MFTRMELECFLDSIVASGTTTYLLFFRVLYNNARQTGNSSMRFALSLFPAVFVGRLFEKTEKENGRQTCVARLILWICKWRGSVYVWKALLVMGAQVFNNLTVAMKRYLPKSRQSLRLKTLENCEHFTTCWRQLQGPFLSDVVDFKTLIKRTKESRIELQTMRRQIAIVYSCVPLFAINQKIILGLRPR